MKEKKKVFLKYDLIESTCTAVVNNVHTKIYEITNINGISIDIETNRNMARIIII